MATARKESGFKALGIFPCSHQSPAARYPPKGDVKAPPYSQYRNNLTALSQCQNLLFIAYVDKIHVYKPQFPQQVISSKPELILDLPNTKSGRGGDIESDRPHAVNQLVVGDLGHEEIVAVVCDDGDVVAYTTRSIVSAIEQYNAKKGSEFRLPRDVRTILLKNVGQSAWGLAVHKTARLIAVSSNTHNISVFAFALCQEPSPENPREPEVGEVLPTLEFGLGPEEWVRPPSWSYPLIARSTRNFEIILEGHQSNVPNVAFCNTDADPYGHYLLSTEIDGSTFVWDIWQGKILADMTAHQDISDKEFSWGVACVDPRSCRLSNSIRETFGCQDVSYRAGRDCAFGAPGTIYNNSASPRLVPGFSDSHHSFHSDNNISAAIMSEHLESEDEDMEAEVGQDNLEGPVANVLGAFADELSPMMSNAQSTPMETDEVESIPANFLPLLVATPHTQTLQEKGQISILPFYIFETSQFDMRLLFDVRFTEETTSCSTVLCEQALHQHIPPDILYLSHFERLNMVLQIPELGIMAVANQVGRVALLTMTKNSTNDRCGFRVEWLLPFRTQETDGQRPHKPLLGMAAGPVQGCGKTFGFTRDEDRVLDGTRRFRLMLTYYDTTILSYEIWRPIADSGSGIQDRILVL